jgi:hypothetical protein
VSCSLRSLPPSQHLRWGRLPKLANFLSDQDARISLRLLAGDSKHTLRSRLRQSQNESRLVICQLREWIGHFGDEPMGFLPLSS